MKDPLISIIIPVWNAEPYLQRCLDSVVNQTLSRIEIICVDDASTDSSLKILNSYANHDCRMCIVSLQQNLGESGARNCGLALVRGKYVGFVDNDDKIDLDFYEKIYENAKETNADISKATRMHYALNKIPEEHNINIYINKNKVYFTSQWWTGIYRKSLIRSNNINFPIGFPLNGDAVFLTKAVICANKVATRNDIFYHYYRRVDSGNPVVMSVEKMISIIETTKIILNYINEKKDILEDDQYDYLYYLHLLRIMRAVLRQTEWKHHEVSIKKMAAETIISYIEKCYRRRSLEHFFSTRFPDVHKALIESNKESLTDIFLSYASDHALNAQILRYRFTHPASAHEDWEITK